MRRARRIVRWVLIGAGALLVLAALFAAFVLFTTPGAKLVLSLANDRELPARARAIEGALASRFVLHDVELSLGAVHASVDTLIVAWHPLALRDHRVHVTDVMAAGAEIVITPGTGKTADTLVVATDTLTTRLNEKTWTFVADHARIRNASLDAPGNVRLRGVDVIASGGPDGYRGDVRASGSVWRFANMTAFVRASGNTRAVTADSLDVHALGGTLRGDGFLRWNPDLSWRGRVHGDSLRADELVPQTRNVLGSVSVRASGTGVHGDSLRVTLDVQSLESTLREKELAARARVVIDGARIDAPDVWVRWGSSQATLSGSMADRVTLRVDATVPELGEVLAGARGSASVRGRLEGSPERMKTDLEVRGRNVHAAGVDVPDLGATLDATLLADGYVPQGADVHDVRVLVGAGRIDTRGTVSWHDGIRWNGAVTAKNIETSMLAPGRRNIYGPLSLRATTEGEKRGTNLSARAAIDSLEGTVRGRALRGEGSVAMINREIDVSALRMEWGDTRLFADGHVGETMDLEFDVAAPNLAAIDSTLQGSVTLRGEVTGARKKPRVTAELAGDSLRAGEYAAGRVEGDIDADLAFVSPADVRLVAWRASRGETVADSVRVTLSGPRDDLRATLAVAGGESYAALTLRGALADTYGRSDTRVAPTPQVYGRTDTRVSPTPQVTWSGWIEDVRLRHDAKSSEWQSHGRAPLFLSRSHVRADSLVLASGAARLSARAEWQRGGTTHAAVDVSGFELSTFEQYLGDAQITGTLNGAGAVTIDPAGGIVGRIDFIPGPGEIALAGRRASYEGRIAGRADASGVSAELDFSLKEAGVQLAMIDANLSIPNFVPGRDSLGTQPLEGGLDIESANIAPLLAMVEPSWSNASGALTAHVSPVGTAGDFKLTGRVAVENGRLDLPSGLRLRDTNLTLVSDGAGQVSLDGTVTSGGGRVTLKASSARSESGWLKGSFTAKGERFQVVNQPDAQVFVSPDVDLQIAERVALVTGRVGVPYARIEVAEVPAAAVAPSNDVVFVEDTLATQPRLQVRTQVRVELGDSVTFSGFGLRARLAGSLAVDDERGRPTRGTGEIQIIDGKYRAFGNELKIDPGRLVFGGGPIDNPGLDIRAYRGLTSQNVMTGSGEIVGMKLYGTLRKPEFSVFSNPPMSQSEIMSYLVLGRPMTTGDDESALANAAMLVGMQRGTGVVDTVGKKFALDEVYFEGGKDIKETSFVAGKYLSPKLYVSYATGLFENTNTFRARYSLTKKWTLQTESGTESGTDLLYWFEHGK